MITGRGCCAFPQQPLQCYMYRSDTGDIYIKQLQQKFADAFVETSDNYARDETANDKRGLKMKGNHGMLHKEVMVMPERMSLEDYKKKVREHLTERCNCTGQEADRLMNIYDDDFQEALEKFSWTPATMAGAMIFGY